MKISRREKEINLKIGGERVEQVNQFKYMGAYFTGKGGTGRAVQGRINAMGRLKKNWPRQLI